MPDQRSDSGSGGELRDEAQAAHLDLALRGRLPCVVCGYDLEGISIKGVCPECGVAVRATILYTVDPRADEFLPITHPRIAGASLLGWSACGALATFASWWPRIADLVDGVAASRPPSAWASWTAVGAAALAALFILGLVRPTTRTPFWKSAMAVAAVPACAALAWSIWLLQIRTDPNLSDPYLAGLPSTRRLMLSLLVQGLLAFVITCVRPNARDFVRRSKAMRTGRVDRQTLLAMLVVIAIAALATGVRLGVVRLADSLGDLAQWIDLAAQGVLALVWALFTLGTIGAVVDSVRLRTVILIPPPSLRSVLGGPPD